VVAYAGLGRGSGELFNPDSVMIVVLSFFSAKPIDLLARYIGAEDEVDAVEMHEPYTYLNGLATKDLEDLIEDIKVRG